MFDEINIGTIPVGVPDTAVGYAKHGVYGQPTLVYEDEVRLGDANSSLAEMSPADNPDPPVPDPPVPLFANEHAAAPFAT